MASFEMEGLEKAIDELKKADLFDDQTVVEMLTAAGDVIVREIRTKMDASGFDIGSYKTSVSFRKKVRKDKNGDPYITVTVNGKNRQGERKATVLFVLNYGRSAEYGEIPGSYFWTNGTKAAEPLAMKELKKIVEQKLKNLE